MRTHPNELARLTQSAYHSTVRLGDREAAAATSRILNKFNDLNAAKKAVTNDVAPMGL